MTASATILSEIDSSIAVEEKITSWSGTQDIHQGMGSATQRATKVQANL